MTVIVLIRRVAKKDHVAAFLSAYEKQRPRDKPGFITEYLTRVEGENTPGLRELGLFYPSPDGVAFVNVAFWEPEAPDRPIAQALLALGIDLLLFTRQGNAVRLDRAALRKLIARGSGKARRRGDGNSKN